MDFWGNLFLLAALGFLIGSYVLVTTVSLPFAILYISAVILVMIALRLGWWILRDASVEREKILTNQATILGHLGEIQKTGYTLLKRENQLPKEPNLFERLEAQTKK